ncbi:MAG TPA: histidine phosphatase family protein [Methylotenera sp.]|nr:histidine phosphatase family protein [Methylotenera sp.]
MANLILWRHAEAEDTSASGEDIDRALTKRGHRDAAKMARWLDRHLPEGTKVFSSPARRCLETAAALNHEVAPKKQRKIKVAEFLGVDSSVAAILKKVMNDDSSKTILIIGHQPNLGLLISKILGMPESACNVKKGAVWWLRQRAVQGTQQTYLFAVRQPDF